MADDAVTQLNEMVERVRKEAYEAGYAAGHKEGLKDAVTMALEAVSAVLKDVAPLMPATPMIPRPIFAGGPEIKAHRAPRGEHRERIAQILNAASAPKSISAVKDMYELEHGPIAYSSVFNALGQLEKLGRAFKKADGRWESIGDVI